MRFPGTFAATVMAAALAATAPSALHAQIVTMAHHGPVFAPGNTNEETVSVNYSLNFRGGADAAGGDKQAAMDNAQHALIGLIKGECDRLQAAMGMQCRLSQMSVDLNLNLGQGNYSGGPNLNGGVSATFTMTPLPSPDAK